MCNVCFSLRRDDSAAEIHVYKKGDRCRRAEYRQERRDVRPDGRALAAELGCSVKPIFGLFRSMEEVQQEVLAAANELYQGAIQAGMISGKYPPYKASGMAYIGFAREERELFKLLFMRDRSGERIEEDRESIRLLLELLQRNLGVSEDDAYLFHLEMWVYVHGIATMIATSYLDWDDEFVSRVLTDAYVGLKYRYQEGLDHARPLKPRS